MEVDEDELIINSISREVSATLDAWMSALRSSEYMTVDNSKVVQDLRDTQFCHLDSPTFLNFKKEIVSCIPDIIRILRGKLWCKSGVIHFNPKMTCKHQGPFIWSEDSVQIGEQEQGSPLPVEVSLEVHCSTQDGWLLTWIYGIQSSYQIDCDSENGYSYHHWAHITDYPLAASTDYTETKIEESKISVEDAAKKLTKECIDQINAWYGESQTFSNFTKEKSSKVKSELLSPVVEIVKTFRQNPNYRMRATDVLEYVVELSVFEGPQRFTDLLQIDFDYTSGEQSIDAVQIKGVINPHSEYEGFLNLSWASVR